MTITVLKEPSPYCFIGNAVTFEIESDSYGAIVAEIISNGTSQKISYYPFKKGDMYRVPFDIAGYLYIESEAIEYPQGDMISSISNFSIPYQVKIGDDYIFNGVAFQGGLDNQLLSTLWQEGFDIFTYRLNSHFEQFLFTTRTHSRTIRLRESELYPFVFIHPGIDISFRSESSKTITTPAQAQGSICIMDIRAIRLNYLDQFGDIPNCIEVWVASEKAFTIRILPKQVSEESYLIKFKNSFGAYELIEVVGKANYEPLLSDPDIYQSLTDFGFYADRRDRLSIQDIIKVKTGYKTKDEILFIRDMVCSDETYFIFPDQSFFRCTVTTDSFSYPEKQIIPQSVSLIITNCNKSNFVSPPITRDLLDSDNGIFDETFDETFN